MVGDLNAQTDRPLFISYSRIDADFARRLYGRLRSLGFRLWRDRSEMEAGRDWWQQIQEAIEKSETMVLCMSPDALASRIVMKEWQHARQVGTRVIPVLAENVDFATVPRWMKKVDWLDVRVSAPEIDIIWPKLIAQLNTPYERKRVPFMAPDLPEHFVQRPNEFDALLDRLLDPAHEDPVAITTALRGAGGFGKTTLAAALCHDDGVINAFSDGILWVTLGENPNVMGHLTTLYAALTGQRPGFSTEQDAITALREQLADRDALIVIDDVWHTSHLRPFLQGGENCARLITTRQLEIAVAANAQDVLVDEMTREESADLLIAGITPPDNRTPFYELARRLGEWPLLLELANGTIRKRLHQGDDLVGALMWVSKALDKRGAQAFDQRNEQDRNAAVAHSLSVSLDLLNANERTRYAELMIFPEDVAVPLVTVEQLWGATGNLDDFDTEDLAGRLSTLSLLRFDLPGRSVRLHDVIRGFLRDSVGTYCTIPLQTLNGIFLDTYSVVAWADLPGGEPYLWDYLAYHLIEAERVADLVTAVSDLRYLARKAFVRDAFAAEQDLNAATLEPLPTLELTDNVATRLHLLRRNFANAGHLLNRVKTEKDMMVTLHSRLKYLPELTAEAAALETSLPLPYLTPSHSLPDLPHPALVRTLAGHTGKVRACAWSPDGRWIVSAADDGMLFVWNAVAGEMTRTFRGHTGSVNACAWSPDGHWIVSAADDGTLFVWDAVSGEMTRIFR